MESEKNHLENSKYRILNFWKNRSQLTKIAIALVILLLFVGAYIFLLQYFSQTPKLTGETPPKKISSKKFKNRSGPLYGVSGSIASIKTALNGNKTITLKSDFGVNYQATIDSKTPIFTVIRQVTKTEIKTTRVKVGVGELKTGERLYLESSKDLIEKTEISSDTIKSIEIFK